MGRVRAGGGWMVLMSRVFMCQEEGKGGQVNYDR